MAEDKPRYLLQVLLDTGAGITVGTAYDEQQFKTWLDEQPAELVKLPETTDPQLGVAVSCYIVPSRIISFTHGVLMHRRVQPAGGLHS
jgi:hypothetical protein